MNHLAIDLGARESQICLRDSSGVIVEEKRIATCGIGPYLKRLKGEHRVVVETCTEAFAVADKALALGLEVRVVPATLARSLGVGARGIKTDQRDARALSEVSARIDLPSVHVPAELSRRRKSHCAMREALVGSRTKLINTVRGWLRGRGQRIPSGGAESFTNRVRTHARTAELELPAYVERQLSVIDELTKAIVESENEQAAEAEQDTICQRLMTVPCVGPVTVLRFVAALDDVGRFPDASRVSSYIGLTPGESSSSDRKLRTGITKAGAPKLRWALVQAAWLFRRTQRHSPLALWALEVEKRRGKKAATVAVARRLSRILFAMWRDGTTYQPSMLST